MQESDDEQAETSDTECESVLTVYIPLIFFAICVDF